MVRRYLRAVCCRVRGTLRGALALACLTLLATACRKDSDMMEEMEMPDSTTVMEALTDDDMQDSLLDIMPGGEMARGDSAASERLLMEKLPGVTGR